MKNVLESGKWEKGNKGSGIQDKRLNMKAIILNLFLYACAYNIFNL